MMTNGPEATVGEILDVKLERPRSRLSLAKDIEYNRLRSEVLTFLYEKQRKVENISSKTLSAKVIPRKRANEK
jgi:nitrate/nitrite transport system ATP-binding protein